ncbi:MAG: carbamoyltransferase HypF [Phycisphaerales bacterium]
MPQNPTSRTIESRTLHVRGQVQGVGFRPFVHRLATSLGLGGEVRNDPDGATIEVRGDAARLDEFERRLTREQPALCRIDAIERADATVARAVGAFSIVESDRSGGHRGRVTVDAATCPECVRELFDPSDRRHRHALVNCTNCGPRYTIVRGLPYDRPQTTMADFAMCPACAAEYANPTDRRFHAQPVCCPSCGPRVRLTDASGRELDGHPIRAAAALVAGGGTLAMKGLGGYHLVVDAGSADAVARLRRGKRRDEKPFAVMTGSLAEAEALANFSDDARRALTSPAAPIVLAPRRAGAPVVDGVAPGLHRLGVMLPCTPMQHLLARELARPLVMTSANLSDDPLVSDDADARRRLAGIADAWLWHDRSIERAVDDSIVLDTGEGVVPLRRARGYAPAPIVLPIPVTSPGLCVGPELKATVAIVDGAHATLSQHLGDLTHTLAFERFRRTIDDLLRLYDVDPAWVACDAHPAYLAHRFALAWASERGVAMHVVQHHHAHFAALLAERGVAERALGVVCDGVGYGADGTSWGGEILVGDMASSVRVARLRPVRLPGGDAAARDVRRCGLSWLVDAFGIDVLRGPLARRVMPDEGDRAAIGTMLSRDLRCPPSSGLGRLFDAASALLGVCASNSYEAQGAMRLETLASACPPFAHDVAAMPARSAGGLVELDHRPLCARLVEGLERGEPVERLARRFHDAVADAFCGAAIHAARAHGVRCVALSGGVFCNAVLLERVAGGLRDAGLQPLVHREIPPNDGGIALGQAATIAARERGREKGVDSCV